MDVVRDSGSIVDELSDAPDEVVAYAEFLDSRSRSSTLGIPGYYVSGGQSEFDVAVMRPVVELAEGIEEGESLLEHLGKMIKADSPAIQLLFGRLVS